MLHHRSSILRHLSIWRDVRRNCFRKDQKFEIALENPLELKQYVQNSIKQGRPLDEATFAVTFERLNQFRSNGIFSDEGKSSLRNIRHDLSSITPTLAFAPNFGENEILDVCKIVALEKNNLFPSTAKEMISLQTNVSVLLPLVFDLIRDPKRKREAHVFLTLQAISDKYPELSPLLRELVSNPKKVAQAVFNATPHPVDWNNVLSEILQTSKIYGELSKLLLSKTRTLNFSKNSSELALLATELAQFQNQAQRSEVQEILFNIIENCEDIRKWNTRDITQTCWGLAQLKIPSYEYFNKVAKIIEEKRLDEFTTSEVTKLAWSFGEIRFKKNSLYSLLCKEITIRLRENKDSSEFYKISEIMSSICDVQSSHEKGVREFFQEVALNLLNGFPMTQKDVIQYIWSFSHANMLRTEKVKNFLESDSNFVNGGNDAINSNGSEFTRLQQSYLSSTLEKTTVDLPSTFQELKEITIDQSEEANKLIIKQFFDQILDQVQKILPSTTPLFQVVMNQNNSDRLDFLNSMIDNVFFTTKKKEYLALVWNLIHAMKGFVEILEGTHQEETSNLMFQQEKNQMILELKQLVLRWMDTADDLELTISEFLNRTSYKNLQERDAGELTMFLEKHSTLTELKELWKDVANSPPKLLRKVMPADFFVEINKAQKSSEKNWLDSLFDDPNLEMNEHVKKGVHSLSKRTNLDVFKISRLLRYVSLIDEKKFYYEVILKITDDHWDGIPTPEVRRLYHQILNILEEKHRPILKQLKKINPNKKFWDEDMLTLVNNKQDFLWRLKFGKGPVMNLKYDVHALNEVLFGVYVISDPTQVFQPALKEIVQKTTRTSSIKAGGKLPPKYFELKHEDLDVIKSVLENIAAPGPFFVSCEDIQRNLTRNDQATSSTTSKTNVSTDSEEELLKSKVETLGSVVRLMLSTGLSSNFDENFFREILSTAGISGTDFYMFFFKEMEATDDISEDEIVKLLNDRRNLFKMDWNQMFIFLLETLEKFENRYGWTSERTKLATRDGQFLAICETKGISPEQVFFAFSKPDRFKLFCHLLNMEQDQVIQLLTLPEEIESNNNEEKLRCTLLQLGKFDSKSKFCSKNGNTADFLVDQETVIIFVSDDDILSDGKSLVGRLEFKKRLFELEGYRTVFLKLFEFDELSSQAERKLYLTAALKKQ